MLLGEVADGRLDPAMGVLYDRYARRVHGIGLQLLRDETLAEELVQETFVRLWRSSSRFDPDRGSVSAYLFTIARRAAIDLHRRRRSVGGPSTELPEELLDDRGDAFDRLVGALDLREALAVLPEHHRQVLELAYDDDLTQEEIAARLGVPAGTVKSRTHHALKALRTQMTAQAA